MTKKLYLLTMLTFKKTPSHREKEFLKVRIGKEVKAQSMQGGAWVYTERKGEDLLKIILGKIQYLF